jgi:hypothetical protein
LRPDDSFSEITLNHLLYTLFMPHSIPALHFPATQTVAGQATNASLFSRPQGAFGVRQLAAAFENSPMHLSFKGSPESGSLLPHSEGFAPKKLNGSRDGHSLRSESQ